MRLTKRPGKVVPDRKELRAFIVQMTAGRPGAIADDTDLIADGLLDSIGMMELLTWLEKEKGLVISDDDMLPQNFRSVAVLHTFLLDHQSDRQ